MKHDPSALSAVERAAVERAAGELTAVVLAGGRARRMGGINKALLRVDGTYLFEHSVHNLSAVTTNIVISSARDQSVFEQLGYSVIDDGEFADHGPLAGIFAALTHCDSDYLAIAACDQLELPVAVYATLRDEVVGTRGVYARSADSEIPTCAILARSLIHEVHNALLARSLRLTGFMQRYCKPVSFPGVSIRNINSVADLHSSRE